MATLDRKRTIKPKEAPVVEAPSLKRQKKAPVRPDMLDPTFRAKSRAPNGDKVKQAASQAGRRKNSAAADASASTEPNGPTTQTSANHNKYCHFCQHVKVRASSMLACENQECCRRFCEHCLMTHLNEDVDPMSSDAWEIVNGKPVWYCPICRNKCCCSVSDCTDDHRHCKAYRYRRRRAELASKRMAAVADKRGVKKAVKSKAPVRPTLELATRSDESEAAESVGSWPASACSTASAWSAADTEAGDVHGHSSDEEEVAADKGGVQDSLVSAVWGVEGGVVGGPPALEAEAHGKEMADFCSIWDTGDADEAMAEEDDDDADDSFRGMYGLMGSAEMDEETAGLGCLAADAADVDEAQWLRRTYETVYNPVARQRALNALVSGIGSKRSEAAGADSVEALATFASPTQPARKCTVMYDFV